MPAAAPPAPDVIAVDDVPTPVRRRRRAPLVLAAAVVVLVAAVATVVLLRRSPAGLEASGHVVVAGPSAGTATPTRGTAASSLCPPTGWSGS